MVESIQTEKFILKVDDTVSNPDEEAVTSAILIGLNFRQPLLVEPGLPGDIALNARNRYHLVRPQNPQSLCDSVFGAADDVGENRGTILLARFERLAVKPDGELRMKGEAGPQNPVQSPPVSYTHLTLPTI